MARPQRRRRICTEPEYRHFQPDGIAGQETVNLTCDEFEIIRLVDHLGLTHEQAAKRMDISRTTEPPISQHLKGENTMRIAVTYEDGGIFQHFGHTQQFKLYDVENGKVTRAAVVDTNGSGHGALATFLQAFQVDALICGGIGEGIGAAQLVGSHGGGGLAGHLDDIVDRVVRLSAMELAAIHGRSRAAGGQQQTEDQEKGEKSGSFHGSYLLFLSV